MAGVGPSFMVKKAGGEEYCSSSMNILLDLPPGFRFHPTDEEIITHYLTHKVMNNSFSARAIGEVDLNKCEPWDLPKKAKMGEKEWYFFCQRDRKYPTGMRTNRATESGYWKATGKDKEIYNKKEGVGYKGKSSNSRSNNCLIGMKKTLVFYKGRAPKGEKSNWVMHEYRLEGKFSYYNFPKAAKDEWVVCRVFHKNTGIKSSPIITGLTRTDSFGNDDHRHLLLDYECPHDNNNSLPPLMVMDFPNNYSNNQGPTAAGSSFADGEEEEIKGTATASSTRSSELEDGGDYDYLSYFDSSANPNINDVDQYDQMQKQQEDQLYKINQFMPHAMAMPTSSSSNPTPQSDFIFYPAAYQNQIQQLPNPPPPPPPPPPVFPFEASPRDDHIINSSSINYLHQKERIGMGVNPIIPLIPGSSSSFKKINMGDDDQAFLRALAQKHETLSTDDDDDDNDMLEEKHCKMEQFSSSNNQYCCQSSMMSASQDTGLSTETSSAVVSKNNMGTSSSRSYHEDKLELEDPSVLGPISDLDYIWNRPNY